MNDTTPGTPKQSWWRRLSSGLKRTSSSLGTAVADLVTKRKLDRAMLDDIEDVLLRADLGTTVAVRIADAVGAGRYDKAISADEVKSVVASEVEKVLAPVAQPLQIDAAQKPFVVLVVGVNGSGKTTTIGKLAAKFSAEGRKVMLAAGDTFRAAAIEQLKVWGERTKSPVVAGAQGSDSASLAFNALSTAREQKLDVLLVDTAGRLGIDEALMAEIRDLHAVLKPIETLFVVDAMQGQDAVNTAKAFKDALPLTGVVLTKLDGDSRGGAALSVRQVTGAPIKFAGVSEKIDGLEVFDAERHAGRVLGMGDIVALVEQVQSNVDIKVAQKLADKVKSGGNFDLNDFLAQISQMKNMGGLAGLMDKLPSQLSAKAAGADMDRAERDVKRMEGIICSMTPLERRKPELIKASRKRRIATGAGVMVQDVNRMLNQFEQMQGMMKKMKGGGLMKMMKKMGGMKGLPGMGGGGMGGGGGMPRF
jgi:signal recognition particle subunit SRP54